MGQGAEMEIACFVLRDKVSVIGAVGQVDALEVILEK